MIYLHIAFLESKGMASLLIGYKDDLIHLNINQGYFSNILDVDFD
jgi:hypothetical protein